MTHEHAFLQAIREAPDDDAPRLIYADWLEEQGGASHTARANFIRIQCRLNELPEDDPACDHLEDEATDILEEYEAEWTRPLHGIAEDWRFSRGFLEHIRVRGENLLLHAEKLFDFAPLRSLHLMIHRNDVPHLAACPQLHWISSLDLGRCQLNDRSLQQLLTSPHLERLSALNLSGNDVNTPGIRTLLAAPLFKQLCRLDLSSNRAIGDNAVRLLARSDPASNLEVLNLATTNLTINGVHELLNSTSLSRLSELNVSGTSAGFSFEAAPLKSSAEHRIPAQLRTLDLGGIRFPIVSPALRHVLRTANLQSLYLSDMEGGKELAELLSSSPNLAGLTHLSLARNSLGDTGAEALADSPYLASLKHLMLGQNNIRDRGAKTIAESPNLRHLRLLDLSRNGIGGPGLKHLAGSTNVEHLRALNLAGNFIGADSVRAISESEQLRNLTLLDLSDAFLEEDSARILASSANLARLATMLLKQNLLSDGGAKALAQSSFFARLSTLDLNDNRIGKAGAEALAAATWRRMRTLDLRGNVFTDTQEQLLRERFGNAVQL